MTTKQVFSTLAVCFFFSLNSVLVSAQNSPESARKPMKEKAAISKIAENLDLPVEQMESYEVPPSQSLELMRKGSQNKRLRITSLQLSKPFINKRQVLLKREGKNALANPNAKPKRSLP
ncbi:MAG: hypothetical protein R8P61_22240 [Bacteroidia bacterium]|nr:hypothetical protein [Bacteroidia bacterium]